MKQSLYVFSMVRQNHFKFAHQMNPHFSINSISDIVWIRQIYKCVYGNNNLNRLKTNKHLVRFIDASRKCAHFLNEIRSFWSIDAILFWLHMMTTHSRLLVTWMQWWVWKAPDHKISPKIALFPYSVISGPHNWWVHFPKFMTNINTKVYQLCLYFDVFGE